MGSGSFEMCVYPEPKVTTDCVGLRFGAGTFVVKHFPVNLATEFHPRLMLNVVPTFLWSGHPLLENVRMDTRVRPPWIRPYEARKFETLDEDQKP